MAAGRKRPRVGVRGTKRNQRRPRRAAKPRMLHPKPAETGPLEFVAPVESAARQRIDRDDRGRLVAVEAFGRDGRLISRREVTEHHRDGTVAEIVMCRIVEQGWWPGGVESTTVTSPDGSSTTEIRRA